MRKTALALLLFVYMTIWFVFALVSFPIYLVAISVEGLILHLRGYKNGYWKFWKQDVRDYPWRVKVFFYGDCL